MTFRVRLRVMLSQFPRRLNARIATAVLRALPAVSVTGTWLWPFARCRPLLSCLAVAAVAFQGSVLFRGEEKTYRDLNHLARRLRESLTTAPPLNESLNRLGRGRAPFHEPVLRHAARFIVLANRARRDREDFLASFEALERAWKTVGGNQKLTIQLIVAPSVEPYTGKRVARSWHAPVAVDQSTFEEMLPVLKEIATLIVEGDGSGRGRLFISGFDVEPVTDAADEAPAAAEVREVRASSSPKETRGGARKD